MSVALHIEGARQRSERIALRDGQVAVVGRSPWVDISLPEETELAEEHFRIDCRHTGCRVQSINGTLLRNGVQTDTAALIDGDSLAAGRLQFRVQISGLTPRQVVAEQPSDRPEQVSRLDDFAGILGRAGLSPEAQAQLVIGDRMGTFDALVTVGLRKDACRFAIACLPRAVAMGWAAASLGAVCGLSLEEQHQLVESVDIESNAFTPEQIDQQIVAHAENSAAAWIWKAARWSHGSLLGKELPPVPPAPHLFALAISVAVSLGSVQHSDDTAVHWVESLRDQLATLTGVVDGSAPR
ncbi:MAG: hypothetical protein KF861_03660 [Planctomycetaceae bacterium]|nr:hypothetical protein [Planctomycetaceae bacterium]